MTVVKGDVTYTLTDEIQLAAFLASGWVVDDNKSYPQNADKSTDKSADSEEPAKTKKRNAGQEVI